MNIADILIHIPPELSVEQRTKIEEDVSNQNGVVSVHFSPEHQHELTIAYDPQSITSEAILNLVRQYDPDAVMIGL